MKTIKLILLITLTIALVKAEAPANFDGEPPLPSTVAPDTCLFNPELSNLNEFWTWSCTEGTTSYYGVTSPDIPNKEVYWLTEDDWQFIFVNTFYNDYAIEWKESVTDIAEAMKDVPAAGGSAGAVPAGQNSDVIITIAGKDVVITAQNIESKWTEMFGDMEGHEVATTVFTKGSGDGVAPFCPHAKTMLAQVVSLAMGGDSKGINALKSLAQSAKPIKYKKKAMKAKKAKAKAERSKKIHKRCVKTAKKLKKKAIVSKKNWLDAKQKAIKYSKLQV